MGPVLLGPLLLIFREATSTRPEGTASRAGGFVFWLARNLRHG
jgi:hypothetical protein